MVKGWNIIYDRLEFTVHPSEQKTRFNLPLDVPMDIEGLHAALPSDWSRNKHVKRISTCSTSGHSLRVTSKIFALAIIFPGDDAGPQCGRGRETHRYRPSSRRISGGHCYVRHLGEELNQDKFADSFPFVKSLLGPGALVVHWYEPGSSLPLPRVPLDLDIYDRVSTRNMA
ncbi:hypothetical protein M413DRAFT_443424 [Hebeloma cylindrosporum]|uniref:Uncharacterized protein n=1 Tax=Hebeloma cylindrosporum TaxID=76867 RepID=A0A0C3C3M0_HEBCY|nr:hypothetical protein M413DRAFT_443424 [Hebeloma cylindrosporum h7]